MNEWIQHLLATDPSGVAVLLAVFVLGMASVVTCGCNFAVIGAVAGYSGASAPAERPATVLLRGLAFLAGSVLAMAIMGWLAGTAGKVVNATLGNYWKIAAGLVSILFGLYSLDLVPFKLPALSAGRSRTPGNLFTAIVFGFTIGGLSAGLNTCCNPVFPVILAASFVKGSSLWGLVLLSSFGLGSGLPLAAMMVGFSLGMGRLAKTLAAIGRIAKYGGGILLVALGFYFLFSL